MLMGGSRQGGQRGWERGTRGCGAGPCCVFARLAVLVTALVVTLFGGVGPASAAPADRPAGARGAAERASSLAANLPVATDARLAGDDSRTRFIVDVSQNVPLT